MLIIYYRINPKDHIIYYNLSTKILLIEFLSIKENDSIINLVIFIS